MTVVVWTPTCRPGMDVAVESISRQELPGDRIHWIIGDDLKRDRGLPVLACADVEWVVPSHLTKKPYSLDAGHNYALRRARELDADLFVFMMDYTWIAPDGIQRFADMAAKHPRSLLTGIAHTADDPDRSLVVDPNGAYTIFAEPYTGKPQQVTKGEDCRLDRVWKHSDTEQRVEHIRWEANWAALPREVLHDERLNFDETYDQFHSCDNIDFALRVSLMGYEIWIDYENVALRLPRRTYWPEEARFKEAEDAGMAYFHGRDHRDRLEIGSGERPMPGWVHLDVRPDAPDVDIVGDGRDLDALGLGFYREMAANHVLEHFSHLETAGILANWRKHILPMGNLHIEVPNLAGHIARYQQDGDMRKLAHFTYGEQTHEFNYHKQGFDRESLQSYLMNAGFSRISVNDVGLVLSADAQNGTPG